MYDLQHSWWDFGGDPHQDADIGMSLRNVYITAVYEYVFQSYTAVRVDDIADTDSIV